MFLPFAIETACQAGQELLTHFQQTDNSVRGTPKEIKTRYDLLADDIIKKAIEKNFPDHSYETEESGQKQKTSEFKWVIDPLDGTGNFMNANPFWAVAIFLMKNNQPILGVIEAPALGERFYATLQGGAFLVNLHTQKETRLRVSETSELSQSYIVSCEGGTKDKNFVLQTIQKFYPPTKDFRKLGSAALELAWVAAGRCEAYITHDIDLWDIAAGSLLVQEAGGEILDFTGQKFDWENLLKQKSINLVATNGEMGKLRIKN